MKNYKQTASDVLRLVGGEKNVVQVEHCSRPLCCHWLQEYLLANNH